ncbi:MAG: heparinase II/III family protein [Gemmatimonadota bacterium]
MHVGRVPVALACVVCGAATLSAQPPAKPVGLSAARLALYQKAVTAVLAMSEQQMLELIPTQSGLYFVGCVHCRAGQQEGQLSVWDAASPGVVRCAFCGHVYPSDDHPMEQVLEVVSPNGQLHAYPYHASRPSWWQGEEPYRSYFGARVDYHRIRYMEQAANRLAHVYAATKDPEPARRAALILKRFAAVYPGYCYHFDYPFQQKIIHDGEVAPGDFRRGFRTARWTWWAYLDISRDLLEAYQLLAGSGQLEKLAADTGTPVAADIEAMFALMADQVLGNRDELTNMSPGTWASLVQAGRVLGRPDHVHTAVGRLRRMVTEQFFYDGSWQEGAPSYHSQVMGGLEAVADAAKGYGDPPGYADPVTGERFDNLDVAADLPEVGRARQALLDMRLPDGRYAPVHDTWWTDATTAPEASAPVLLPALGHGILGRGAGDDQRQVHVTWSPGYGHIHYDGLSLLLFARGRELLSDIGYTHTRWREWSVTSAAHNLVVVDGANQVADRTTYGSLRCFDAANAGCQVLSVDNPGVYPGIVDTYRRTVALVDLDRASSYLIDIFQVRGGAQHDYFLHGSADEAQDLTATTTLGPMAMTPWSTLVPDGVAFSPGESEQSNNCMEPGFAYGYLSGLREARLQGASVVQLDYVSRDREGGLRAWCVARPGDELFLGSNPAIRPARADDSRLGEYLRAFTMLRRRGGASLFAAIAEPHGGEPRIQAVDLVDLPGAELALQVAMAGRRDLVIVNASQARGQWQGQVVTATAELAVVRDPGGATVVNGQVRWGELGLQSDAPAAHRLLAVARSAQDGSLLLEGRFLPPAGTVIALDHAGQRTSAYRVASSAPEGDNSRVALAGDPGFEYDAAAGTSRFVFLPLTSYTGLHVVRWCPVAHVGSTERTF